MPKIMEIIEKETKGKYSVKSISVFHAVFAFVTPIKLMFNCSFQIPSLCGVSILCGPSFY